MPVIPMEKIRKVDTPPARKVALAIGAHPDDIEFLMAGTLLQLQGIGYSLHYLCLSNGNCGSLVHNAATIARIRTREARRASGVLGAIFHPPFCRDLEIFYDLKTLRRLACVIRRIRPTVLLTHSPDDYMEDHRSTCRLAVSAAFVRGVPNFQTSPRYRSALYDVAIYHAMPHGLGDEFGHRITPDCLVNTAPVQELQQEALVSHLSQRDWLEATQGLGSYIQTMVDFSREMARLSTCFSHAEGWRRHSPLGFSHPGFHPLQELGRDFEEVKR